MSEQEEDFAAMFAASTKARQVERGQTVQGTIVAFGAEVAFVNVGGKGEAEIDLAELKDADGKLEASVGDRIEAVVVSTSGPLATTSAPFHIGSMAHVFGTFLDGRVDSITFWKGYVPTSSEQSELWNGGDGLDYDAFGGGFTPHARRRRFRFGGRPLRLAA